MKKSTNDLVGGAGDHVAAGGRHVLGKRNHPNVLFRRKLADAAIDQMRLHRRSPGGVDQERDCACLAHPEGALEGARDIGEREAWLERRRQADHTRQTHHGNERHIAQEPLGQYRAQRLPGAQKKLTRMLENPLISHAVALLPGGPKPWRVASGLRPQPARSQVTVRQPMPAPAQARKAAGSCGSDEGPTGQSSTAAARPNADG